jgi:Uma2 family endonuclease
MSLPHSHISYSAEEYLDIERGAAERHEYLDGHVYAMVGESPEHGTICTNIGGQLYNQLKEKDCQAFSKHMKVRSGPNSQAGRASKGLFSYPDLVVVCGELRFTDEYRDVLLNPTVIIVVLSPTTEAFDRGEKWVRYQSWLPELSDYLLVSQAKPQVEHYQRQASGEWLYSLVADLDGKLHLASIGCTLHLTEIYDRIRFPTDAIEVPVED